MSVSLQQRLAEVAKEFEDQKFRQLDLYQRQLRKARDALQDKEQELAETARELEDAKKAAEDAEAQCAAESQGSVEMTREIIALKFELAAAIEMGRRNARSAAQYSARHKSGFANTSGGGGGEHSGSSTVHVERSPSGWPQTRTRPLRALRE